VANHGYVTTRRKLTPEQVDQDIREIVKRRFKGEVEVEYEKLSEKPTKRRSEGWEFWNIWASWRFSSASRWLAARSSAAWRSCCLASKFSAACWALPCWIEPMA